ncbi:hypothetical protein WJX72_001718 [[Myrmecia] bisecta]|uniref:Uncharacterized protein n=1 Tax=[Myrmecia] bisecta TaxID=41462 RepID=A0AAW1QPF4_9CHLO
MFTLSVFGQFAAAFACCIVAFVLWSRRAFHKAVLHKAKQTFESPATADHAKARRVSLATTQELPEPVQRYLRYSLKEGQPFLRGCKLEQMGQIRLRVTRNPLEGWLSLKAEQWMSALQPAYVWSAAISWLPLVSLQGYDACLHGRGEMCWKLMAAVPVVKVSSDAISTAALIRFVGECAWCPTALLPSDWLRWEPVSSDSATAVVKHAGHTVSATFSFNAVGQITSITTAERVCVQANGTASFEKWSAHYRRWEERSGMMVPLEGEAVWNFADHDFSYVKLRVVSIEHVTEQPVDR